MNKTEITRLFVVAMSMAGVTDGKSAQIIRTVPISSLDTGTQMPAIIRQPNQPAASVSIPVSTPAMRMQPDLLEYYHLKVNVMLSSHIYHNTHRCNDSLVDNILGIGSGVRGQGSLVWGPMMA